MGGSSSTSSSEVRRFLRWLGRAGWPVLLLCGVLFLLQAVVDPYGLLGAPVRSGINQRRPYAPEWGAEGKWYEVARRKPCAVIIGTSRGEAGLDPADLGMDCPVFNLASPRLRMGSTLALLRHASDSAGAGGLKRAVVAVDFLMFNALLEDNALRGVGPGYWLRRTLTRPALIALGHTLADSRADRVVPRLRSHHMPDGLRRLDGQYGQDMRSLFYMYERIYAEEDMWVTQPARRFAFMRSGVGEDTLRDFADLLRLAHERGIALQLMISPSHARLWETLNQMGLWPQWEAWKRALVEINRDTALASGREPFPLFDFSGFNAITTEEVPPLGSGQPMRHYLDDSHFVPEVGRMALERMAGRAVPDGFGVPLTVANVESHLEQIRAARQVWADAHPVDVLEIMVIVNARGLARLPQR